MTIAAIWAQTRDGVIGRDNKIPWHYPGDFKRFKELTLGSVVIMGRKTWESIGKLLPQRHNMVITGSHKTFANVTTPLVPGTSYSSTPSISSALGWIKQYMPERDIWFIGGNQIFTVAMAFVDYVDVTTVPDEVPRDGSVLAPSIGPLFEPGPIHDHKYETKLTVQLWHRRGR